MSKNVNVQNCFHSMGYVFFHQQLVLLCGNYMNAGTRNERSYGYDLGLLTKVSLSIV